MARGADVACGTCADVTRHARPRGRAAQVHVAESSKPTLSAGGAQVAWTHGRAT